MEMTIRYEKSVFNLKTMAVDDFPAFEKFNGGFSFSIPADTFRKLVRQSSFAASSDETKGVFTGLLWEIDGEALSVIGSDTHRLAWVKGSASVEKAETKGSFIIPARMAVEAARLIQEDVCLIQADNNTVFFSFDNIKINCRRLNGAFPDFRRVIPENFITSILVDSKLLRDATERISLFSSSSDSRNTIFFDVREGMLSLHSRSDIGFGREEYPVEHEGEGLEIVFNSRYIIDVFKAIDGEKVFFQLSGQISAGIMKDTEDDHFMYLVLPVKV